VKPAAAKPSSTSINGSGLTSTLGAIRRSFEAVGLGVRQHLGQQGFVVAA